MSITPNLSLTKINADDFVSPDPINLAFDIIDKLGVDYVVEQGTSGEWWYRKWKSGRAECGIDHKNFGDLPHTQTWGSVYTSRGLTFGNYPFAFVDKPYSIISFLGTSDQSHWPYVAQRGSNSTTISSPFALMDPLSGIAKDATFGIYVCGRYK